MTRKRNPYSIEELLKKPEKRRKTEHVKEESNESPNIVETNEELNSNIEVCD